MIISLQQMLKKQQLNLDYKLQPPPQRKITQFTIDSKTTFENQSTPGWTSLMHTEPNQEHPSKNRLSHHQILQRLNQMSHIDLSNSNFSKIKIEDDNQNPRIISKEQMHHFTQQRNNKENDSFQRHNLSVNNRSQQRLTSSIRTNVKHSKTNQTSYMRDNIPGTIIKNKSRKKDKPIQIEIQRQKRFKQISVHQHLYLQAKKLTTKRTIEQIMDSECRKKRILTFRPQLSQKSRQLAQVKFSRMEQRQSLEQQLTQQLNNFQKQKNHKHQVNPQYLQRQRQHHRHQVLNRLFYKLSQNQQFIRKDTIKSILEDIPIICIKFIEVIIQKVFQGKSYTWLEFLSAVNDKTTVSNKQGLICVSEKWMSRQHYKEHQTKDETHPHL